MNGLYELGNWLKHPPVILPPTADKWRLFPVALKSGLLRVSWTVPKGSTVPAPFFGLVKPILITPLGELDTNPIASPITTNPKQYQFINIAATGFDYQLRYRADNSKFGPKLEIWEFLPAIPAVNSISGPFAQSQTPGNININISSSTLPTGNRDVATEITAPTSHTIPANADRRGGLIENMADKWLWASYSAEPLLIAAPPAYPIPPGGNMDIINYQGAIQLLWEAGSVGRAIVHEILP